MSTLSDFNDDPFDWSEQRVSQFLKAMKVSQRLIDVQQTLCYKGADFLMYDEDNILKFYQVKTPEEKKQMIDVKNAIFEKSQNFNGDSIEDSTNLVISQPLKVTGEIKNFSVNSSSMAKQFDNNNSDTPEIGIAKSGFISYNELPYDPFDFDSIVNLDSTKSEFENLLKKSSLHRQYQDYKAKRIELRQPETQLVLEVKKTVGTTGSEQQGSVQSAEKFSIKENQSVTLGQANCDLVLKDKAVSRRHALVENTNGTCSISDLGSSCGTFVRIKNQQIPLQEGSIFECGFQEFQIIKIDAKGESAQVKLQIYDGTEVYKGKVFDLTIQNRFLIGRDIRCHFGSQFQEDKDLSSYHSKLSIKDNVLSIMDLDSIKGTWLRLSPQKKPSTKFALVNDSEIKINPFIITVKINQMGSDMFVPSSPTLTPNNLCIICKQVKPNLQLLPCQHVVCCKSCFQKLNTRTCPKPDCNTPIRQVETLYNC